jgi:DNA-binding IclR family transcriptional regulator
MITKAVLPKSTFRVISVLKSFSADEPELNAADISRKTGIHKTTLHRLLLALTEEGLLERDKETNKYKIGPALYTMGSLYLDTTDLLRTCKPVAEVLNDLTKETIFVAVLRASDMIWVMKCESKHVFRIARYPGDVAPAYATALGRALLSDLPDAEIDRMYPEEELRQITKYTINSRTKLKQKLKQVRKTGISIDREGSYERVEGIASLIRDANGKGVAAISIAFPIFEVSELNTKRLGTLVKMGASLASYRLGYQDTDNPIRSVEEIISWWEKNESQSS